jgi:hypothetical protein
MPVERMMVERRSPVAVGARALPVILILSLAALALLSSPARAEITGVLRGGSSANLPPAVAPAGLADGRATYVDRTHTWASVPPGLQGIPYVQAANGDKELADYSLQVTVSAAGTLYLFVDYRVGDNDSADGPDLAAAMTWAASQGFADTGESLGIDEANDGDVDQRFAVYARAVAAGAHTLLAQADGPSRNLYAVAFEASSGPGPFTPIPFGSTWKRFLGTEEASNPIGAWRTLGFNDTAWDSGAAPLGYGEPVATALPPSNPAVPGEGYSTVFLRRTFQVADPAAVGQLQAIVDYDDGLALWVNGTEVARVNVNGLAGEPFAYSDLSSSGHERGFPEAYDLPDPSAYLVAGTNVAAVMLFNVSLTSTDLYFDLELLDPFVEDTTPPEVSLLVPAPGATVRTLTQVVVDFDEDVAGVSASDLRVGGSPATGLTGAGPYTFTFPEPPAGAVAVSWAAGHGITDLAAAPNAFQGGSWSYTLDPDAPLGAVVLNEILAANRTGIVDEDGEAEDWLELRNTGSEAVDLGGWSVTDDPDDPDRFILPSRILAPGGFLVIFASGKDRRPASGNIHASFSLATGGEYLALLDGESPRGVVSEIAPRFPRQRADYSHGLDGAGLLTYFETPTPGAPNAGSVSFDGFVIEPVVTPARGFYDEPVLVTISAVDRAASIRYTLDGSEPTPSAGTLYTGPITIAPPAARGLVPLRAVAYRDGYLPSDPVTHSYIFIDNVLTQPASQPGFPATWAGNQPADYAMDARVVADPAHAAFVREGLTSIPTLSLVSAVGNFFGPSGNMANPSQSGDSWERPISAELIYPDGRPGFQVNCGHRVQGGSSTDGWKSIKVSQQLLFKGDYGPTKLEFPLFPDTHVAEFDRIVLDAHLNQTWNHPDHSQRVRAQYCRDMFASDIQNAMGGFAPHDILVNLYLDGVYWGVYDAHENPEASFAESYFGGDKLEYDAVKHDGSTVVDGNGSAWSSMMTLARSGLASQANYDALAAVVDLVDLADYMLVNIFAGNDDWPRHNWYATRRRVAGARWRFHSWDAEHIIKSTAINQTGANDPNSPAEVFQLLRANPEFRLLVADRVERHWFNGGPLEVDAASSAWDPAHPERNRPAALWMRRIDEIDPAIACESARWGDAKRSAQPYTRNNEWMTELTWVLNYFRTRSSTVLSQLRSANLYPAVGAPVLNQHGGRIQPGFILMMSRPDGTSGTVYYTLDGTDPRVPVSGAVSPAAAAYGGAITLDETTHVKARTLDGVSWSALTEAVFTFTEPAEVLRFSEILYNPAGGAAHEFIEIQNTGATTVDLFGLSFTDGITSFPLDTTLGPGAYFVAVSDPAAFAARYPGVEIGAVFQGNLANGGERMALTDSEGRTVIEVTYADEGLWQVGADGFGWSLVNLDPQGDPNDPESWGPSADPGGSPGAGDEGPAHGRVVINEVLARAAPPLEEAIELHNLSTDPVDVGGWFLSDSRADEASLKKHRIAGGTVVPPGSYAVVYEVAFGADLDLSDLGGSVYLAAADAGGALTGYVVEASHGPRETGVSFGRHATSVGFDATALSATTFGSDSPATVTEFRSGTGRSNAEPDFGAAVINEILYDPLPGREEFIEILNPTGAPLPLHDAGSGMGWLLTGVLNVFETDSYRFGPGDAVPAGGYLLLVSIDPALFRSLHSVPASVPVLGPYGGRLDNGGEEVALYRPDPASGRDFLVDRVVYDNDAPWAEAAGGGGFSLERLSASSYANDPVNWDASTRIDGTPGAENTVSGSGANRVPEARFTPSPATGSAPLEVFFDARASYDLDGDIVLYRWDFDDGTMAEGDVAIHTFSEGGYFVQLTVRDDLGAEDTLSILVTVGADLGGRQVPGDCNQDGFLDIGDAICLLAALIDGPPAAPPCGGAGSGFAGMLEDFDGSGGVGLADALGKLNYLFLNGSAHDLGERCLRVPGCTDVCR